MAWPIDYFWNAEGGSRVHGSLQKKKKRKLKRERFLEWIHQKLEKWIPSIHLTIFLHETAFADIVPFDSFRNAGGVITWMRSVHAQSHPLSSFCASPKFFNPNHAGQLNSFLLSRVVDYYSPVISLEISLTSPTFFFRVIWAILGPLHYHMNFRISLSISTKKPYWDCDWHSTESIDQFGENWHLNNVELPDPYFSSFI